MKLTANFLLDLIDTLYVQQANSPRSKATHGLITLGSGFEIEIIVRSPENLSESTKQQALTDIDVLL